MSTVFSGEAYFFLLMVISIAETLAVPPSLRSICSVLILISLITASVTKRCRIISAVSTARLIALPRAFKISFWLPSLSWVMHARTYDITGLDPMKTTLPVALLLDNIRSPL